MKVGDLVIRKRGGEEPWQRVAAAEQREALGVGVVLSKQMSGKPAHPCLTVYYAKVGKSWDIAESYMEVVSESR
jgi:hypothetical protein